jgi:hypothetical protein
MRKIFIAARGHNRVPVMSDSLVMYFDATHNIKARITAEYTNGEYDRSKTGQYLVARRVVITEVQDELTEEEKTEVKAFHDRRCRRWRKGLETSVEGDDEVDLDNEMSEEELDKLRQDITKAADTEKREKEEDDADAQVEEKDSDVTAILE